MIEIIAVIDQLGTAIMAGKNALQFAEALEKYVEFLSQKEKNEDLLFTRVMTHLENIYEMVESSKSLYEPEDGCFGGYYYGD